MQLFHLLKQASNNGPNENDAQKSQAPNKKRSVSHAGMKEEDYIQNHDTKDFEGLQHMRIDEVEDEHENTRNDDEERAYDSDAAREQRHQRQQQQDYSDGEMQDSPIQHHRGSKGSNVFKQSGQFGQRHSNQNTMHQQNSYDRNRQSPVNSSLGMACIIDPANVDPQSPDKLNESLDNFSPRNGGKYNQQRPVDIYIDQNNPVATSGYFPKHVTNTNDKHATDKNSPKNMINDDYQDQKRQNQRQSLNLSPEVELIRQSHQTGSDILESPKINNKGSSQRNYFRRDQENKALVQSMRKSDAGTKLVNALEQKSMENKRDNVVSQHDQNMGGLHEHHGSQHDESKLQSIIIDRDEIVGQSQQQWHDVKVVQSEEGSQELVIENLENLGDATSLVVTRDQEGNFKIGIQQDKLGSDVMSNAPSTTGRMSSVQKLKLRGKFGTSKVGGGVQNANQSLSILPQAVNESKFRTLSVNSHGRSSKHSNRSRITMPQIANTMVVPNKYKTFQDPIMQSGSNEKVVPNDNDSYHDNSSMRYKKRVRESASDNKRLLNEHHSSAMFDPRRKVENNTAIELRSQFQSAQAEEIIRQSRDVVIQHQLSMSRGAGGLNNGSPVDQLDKMSNQQFQQQQHNNGIQQQFGFVRVTDPLAGSGKKSVKKDPLDRSDSKLGPSMLQNTLRKPSNGSQYQKSTHRANSSVHSREAAAAALTQQHQHLYQTPDQIALKQSNVSMRRLQNQGARSNIAGMDQSLSSFVGAITEQQHHTVKHGKKDFSQFKKGGAAAMSGIHGLYSNPGQQHQNRQFNTYNDRTPHQHTMMNMNMNGSDHMINVDTLSQAPDGPIYEEARSRQSYVSHKSNTDMKGENLVKFSKDQESMDLVNTSETRNNQNKLLDSKETNKLILTQQSSKQDIDSEAPDKQVDSLEQNDLNKQMASPPKTAGEEEILDQQNHMIAQQSPHHVTNPSHTQTAFYEGKILYTDPNKNNTTKVSPRPPTIQDKQLSEVAASPQAKNDIQDRELNYHTTAEDAGDNYFPQILKYTENAPQESILSRDNYSTSNQPSVKPQNYKVQQELQQQDTGTNDLPRAQGPSRIKKYFNKNSNSSKQLLSPRDSKLTSGQGKPMDSGLRESVDKNGQKPRNLIQQNVARMEKQNPSTKASILSHSIQEEDDRNEINQRSSLEHVEEESGQHQSNMILKKDGSAYNIEANDIAAIPQKRSPKKIIPVLDVNKLRSSTEIRSSQVRDSQTIKTQNSKTSIRSSQHNPLAGQQQQQAKNQSKLSNTQRSKGSLASKQPHKEHRGGAQSMLPTLTRQSDTESKNPVGLKSSNRHQHKQQSDRSPMPQNNSLGQSTRTNKKQLSVVVPPEELAMSGQQQMLVGNAGVYSHTQPEGGLQSMKLPSVVSPVGQHLAEPSNRTTILSNRNKPKAAGAESIRSTPPQSQLNRTIAESNYSKPQPMQRVQDNTSMLDNMAQNQQAVATEGGDKPIMRYMEGSDAEQKSYPLKYFKGQDLELYYMEKQLKPGVEREIKEGFFEIRKKFGEGENAGEEVQVYVSHLCLHNYHPIFCKFNLDVVKTILNFSQIIYLKKGQTLYQQGFNDRYLYVILFGKLRLSHPETDQPLGQPLNIGWTVGEEILFKSDRKANGGQRLEKCRSLCESCVLGIEKRSLAQIKRTLVEKGQAEEFVKLEVVLRGNYLVKKAWRN